MNLQSIRARYERIVELCESPKSIRFLYKTLGCSINTVKSDVAYLIMKGRVKNLTPKRRAMTIASIGEV